jgi:hypothetical protein
LKFVIRIIVAAGVVVSLTGCAGSVYTPAFSFGGPPMVSGMSPPAPYAANSIPQPANSLPLGAQGIGSDGAFVPPNYASVTVAVPHL